MLAAGAAGCATPSLDAARTDFYAGRMEKAARTLENAVANEKDRALLWMERGTIRQAVGRYEESAADFLHAADLLESFETYSVSQGAASLVVNDTVQPYRGAPYERTLLFAFGAHNYLALARWDDAAVEGRRMIRSLEPDVRRDFPDHAYARYLAGLTLELLDDPSNAALQYRRAAALAEDAAITPETGRLAPAPAGTNEPPRAAAEAIPPPPGDWDHELVCSLLLGRSPDGYAVARDSDYWLRAVPPRVEIHIAGRPAGRAFRLGDTLELAATTERLEAARRAAKAITRIVIKEGLAHTAAQAADNEAVGELVRLILYFFEQPDYRRWETLPRWLMIARVPCPAGLTEFDVVTRNRLGNVIRRDTVRAPLTRRRKLYWSLYRDTLPPPGP